MQEYKFIGGELEGQTLKLPEDVTAVRASLRYGKVLEEILMRQSDYYHKVVLERPIKVAAFVHINLPYQEAFD